MDGGRASLLRSRQPPQPTTGAEEYRAIAGTGRALSAGSGGIAEVDYPHRDRRRVGDGTGIQKRRRLQEEPLSARLGCPCCEDRQQRREHWELVPRGGYGDSFIDGWARACDT